MAAKEEGKQEAAFIKSNLKYKQRADRDAPEPAG